MTIRAKINPDTAPSSASAMGAKAQWRQNHQNLRAAVLAKASQTSTSKFDRTCDGLNGRDLVFESADPRADRFTLVRREIAKYVRK